MNKIFASAGLAVAGAAAVGLTACGGGSSHAAPAPTVTHTVIVHATTHKDNPPQIPVGGTHAVLHTSAPAAYLGASGI